MAPFEAIIQANIDVDYSVHLTRQQFCPWQMHRKGNGSSRKAADSIKPIYAGGRL